ncbi:non-ribosomal peptide synthetase [Streptomyces sioyaensis]|uniref:non-ribosomal peptide synthetase n=1 Tax=Streptomyces sioyaensis TaxID=67364 RepID=UPI0037CF9243
MKDVELSECVDLAAAILTHARDEPERPALMDGDVVWTYAEMSVYARRIERCLRASGVTAGDTVVVQGRRSPRTVATLLGVLLADAAYVALGERTPAARLHRIVDQLAPTLVLAEEPDPFHGGTAKVMDQQEIECGEPAPEQHSGRVPRDGLPGYIVFTSGTTGTPKGVVIARGSLARHAEAVRRLFGLTPGDRVLQSASLAFDVAAEEIWPTLLAGACVDLLPGSLGEASFDRLTRIVNDHGITVCNLPASYFSGWASRLDETGSAPASLRLVITGSEDLPIEVARNWCGSPERSRLIHAYGVSEATITSVVCELQPDLLLGERVPIGKPLPGVRTAVVDERDMPVRPGTDGQLLIGGTGVALGYGGADPLQEERFLQGPVQGVGQGPWYRTGDRVYEEQGLLYFLGRLDDQIKVNGVRIDPSEIAAALASRNPVTDAKAFKIGERLVGCVCAPCPLEPDTLLAELQAVLPPAMIPAEILCWEQFPVTDGGKVDVGALRAAAAERLSGLADAGHTTDVGQTVRRLWQEILGQPEIGANSDFFALGGDSLSAARLSSALLRETGVAVKLKTIFSHPRLDDYLTQVRLIETR